jgi:hypothetical protein
MFRLFTQLGLFRFHQVHPIEPDNFSFSSPWWPWYFDFWHWNKASIVQIVTIWLSSSSELSTTLRSSVCWPNKLVLWASRGFATKHTITILSSFFNEAQTKDYTFVFASILSLSLVSFQLVNYSSKLQYYSCGPQEYNHGMP